MLADASRRAGLAGVQERVALRCAELKDVAG
jgi:hypothetical protein